MLTTDRLQLEPIGPEHLDNTRRWANDPDLNAAILRSLPVTRHAQEQWYARLVQSSDRLVWAVKTSDTDEHIGNTGLYHLDFLHRRGEFWVLIGEKSHYGHGYGSEIVSCILQFGFLVLNLNRIYLNVGMENRRAIALYEKHGFLQEGILREHYYIRGSYMDVMTMGILRSDYDKSK